MNNDNEDQVFLNSFGYYEIKRKPSKTKLKEFYNKKYYQELKGTYKKEYSKEEKDLIFNKLKRKKIIIEPFLNSVNDLKANFLDVGCGEGWALNYFSKCGWDVKGIDYSSHGCELHNPQLKNKIMVTDIEQGLKEIIQSKKQYELVQLDNVLEHLISPKETLENVRKVISPGGILIVEVPNDFSIVQENALNSNQINDEFWVVYPDHLSYFNKEGLNNLLISCRFKFLDISTDYPIDLNLFNPDTNYINDKTKGKNVHYARVQVENLLSDISLEKSIEIYKVFARMGLGRNLIGFYKKT